jgi:hypothetical protein
MIKTKKKDWEIFAEAMDNTPKKDYKDLRK